MHASLSADQPIADAALWHWPGLDGATATSINISENHCFRVDARGRQRFVLRLHRPGYQARAAVESELAWVSALGETTDIPVPGPVRTLAGGLVAEVAPDRTAALFHFEQGIEPDPERDLAPLFETIGRYAALTHEHAAVWTPPAGFQRPTLDAAFILDHAGAWGDWRRAPHVEGPIADILEDLERRLCERLDVYGRGPDRFGLIHGDMRLGNLLVDGERVVLLDFDDCGFGWLLYDLAASLSFIETSPQVPKLITAWLGGYGRVRPLPPSDLGLIETMLLLRRMALLAWIGSHSETRLAAAHLDSFAVDTAALAIQFSI